MDDRSTLARRTYLLGCGAGLATALAGCTTEDGGANETNGGQAGNGDDGIFETGNATDGGAGNVTDGEAGNATDGGAGNATDGGAGNETDGLFETENETDGGAGNVTNGGAGNATAGQPGNATEGQSDGQGEQSVQILRHEWYEEEFSAGVRGRLENVSGGPLDYVEVSAVFLNDEGVQIGSNSALTTDLAAGRIWAFDVTYLGTDASQVAEYELETSLSAF